MIRSPSNVTTSLVPSHRATIRSSSACEYCRSKKIKCNGSSPCGNCFDRGKECTYPPHRRRRGKHRNEAVNHCSPLNHHTTLNGQIWVEERCSDANRVQYLGQPMGNASDTPAESILETNLPRPATLGLSPKEPVVEQSAQTSITTASQSSLSEYELHSGSVQHGVSKFSNVGALTPDESEFDSEESTIELKDINWEHHGPGSWLSICSKPGIRWVSDKVGSIEFREVAQGLVADWTKHLTLSQYPTTQHGPDLDFETAWRYSTSYFDSTQDAAFGVVDRADFEDHLQRHFQSAGTDYGDAASYALRNAVYAVGCRAMPAYTCSDPSQNQDESLQLFFNALSELPNLLFMPSGLRAVQALAVMTSYAELLGSPSVEYMLCGAAARLAQSKGLHRQPATAWCLPEREKFHRECIFWTIYCYDKGLALRCGRPSMLENDEISCQIPTRTPSGSAVDLDVLVASIRHAQICADIFKSLYSPKSLNKPPDDLLQQIRGIDQKLEEWRSSLPDRLARPQKKSPSYREEPDMNQAHAIRLLRAYNGSIIALYASFHYPWIRSRLRKQREVPSPDSISAISARVAEAARRILTTLTECRPVCISTGPTAFYFPMLAIINLFIYILEYPTTKTAQSDIALLDIGVGHFGQIYHLTSGRMSFQFSRQVAVLACKAVERAASRAANNATPETSMNNSKDALDDPNDTVVPLHDALISPGQWSALSADLFNDFSMEGEMIML